jgi:hypothetical protein
MKPRAARLDRSIAIHEAGHAVAHYFLHEPIEHVTIVEAGDTAGYVRTQRPLKAFQGDETSARYLKWVARAERNITIDLCGMLAQQREDRKAYRSVHGSSDRDHAVSVAEHVIGCGGPVLDKYLSYRSEVAKAFVELRWPQILAVADALLARRTLSWEELQNVIRESLGIASFNVSRASG